MEIGLFTQSRTPSCRRSRWRCERSTGTSPCGATAWNYTSRAEMQPASPVTPSGPPCWLYGSSPRILSTCGVARSATRLIWAYGGRRDGVSNRRHDRPPEWSERELSACEQDPGGHKGSLGAGLLLRPSIQWAVRAGMHRQGSSHPIWRKWHTHRGTNPPCGDGAGNPPADPTPDPHQGRAPLPRHSEGEAA